jgi:hypothetical protein
MLAIYQNLAARLRMFARDRAANVAITFGIATLPVISAVGAAIDYSHANAVKAAMQAALDSTALMLSRDAATLNNADLQSKAKAYFTAPAKDSNYTYKDIIILMSDGMNTENRFSSNQSEIDKRMYDPGNSGSGTCANAKASGVTIYSVQVNTGGDPTSTVMKNCATSSDKFWEIKSSADLGTVFNTIGTNLSKLRVAK